MGWMEVLALLKRIAPLLGRLAPMLEAFLATRTGSRVESDAALERLAADMHGQLQGVGEKHESLAGALAAQATQIAALADSLSQLRKMEGRNAEALLELQTDLTGIRKLLQSLAAVVVLLLVTCVALLVMLLLRHPA